MTSSKIDLRFYTTRPGAAGSVRRFWQPTGKMKKAGWELERLPDDEGQAVARVRDLNTRYDNAQNGRGPAGNYAVLPDQLAAARAAAIESGRAMGDNHPPADLMPAPATHSQAPRGSVGWVIDQWYNSVRWTAKPGSTIRPFAHRTMRQYRYAAEIIRQWAQNGHTAVRALRATDVQDLYRAFIEKSHSVANLLVCVLRIILEFARKTYGLVEINVAQNPGMISLPPRLRIVGHDEQACMIAHADALGMFSVGDAVALAHDMGQREGDVLSLTRLRWQAGRFKLKQKKTGALIDVPATPRLQARIAAAIARIDATYAGLNQAAGAMGKPAIVPPAQLVVCEGTGRRYSEQYFRQLYARIRAAAAGQRILLRKYDNGAELWNDADLDATAQLAKCPTLLGRPAGEDEPELLAANFQDYRDTFVTNSAEAGATIPEICAVSGHAEKSAYNILKHYLALNSAMATNAIEKVVTLYDRREEERRARLPAVREEGA